MVIKNERNMAILLKFLIHSLNTVDGCKNSATKMKRTLFKNRIKQEKALLYNAKLNKDTIDEIRKQVHHQIMTRTLLTYKIMKVRAKISYAAFVNKMTTSELILSQILETYTHYNKQ